MTKDEKNRRLAEWLGYRYKPQPAARTVYAEDDECGHHPITEKYTAVPLHLPTCVCPSNILLGACISAKLPDFFTDEAANAMLLEKMPVGSSLNRNAEVWTVLVWYTHKYTETSNADRKTAICEAALKLIGEPHEAGD